MKYFYTTTKISDNMHETPEGFLICVGVPIARTGEMIYADGETPLTSDEEGKVIIHREEKDVFNPITMASFEGKPVTITHPTEFVTPQNWKELAKGVVQNVRRGEGDQKNDLLSDLLITDSVAISLIKSGLREVSCGYEANYTQIDDGEGKQSRIIGNHVALVDQGRAGSSYAINDHKGKGIEKMKLTDKIKSIFAKAQDEAMKVAEDASTAEKEGEKKDDAKDEDKKEDAKSKDAMAYDELVKMCDALAEKVKSLGSAKDADADKSDEKKDDAKDEEVSPAIEDRLKALEASVAKLLESKASDADAEKEEEAKDADGEEEAESEDEDFEENTMTGDAKSRLEILAPGMQSNVKDAKAKALKTAYATEEGKKVIDSLTGGKPTFDSAEKVETLFVAASEVLKAQRSSDLSKTKQGSLTRDSESSPFKGAMTPEEMNAINEKFWKKQA